MNVVSFYAPRPEHPFFRDYAPFLNLLRLSCDRFGHRHIVLTDDASVGADAYVTKLPRSLMTATVAAQLAYLEDPQFADVPTLLTGADCVLARDPETLNTGGDIVITTDDRFQDCRMNCGAIYIPRPALLAPVWRDALARCGDEWGDDQTSVYTALKDAEGLYIQEQPCDPCNLAPDHPGDDCRRGVVLHFRGARKDWMVPYCHHWLGLGEGAQVKAAPNMTEEAMLANVRINAARNDIEWLQACEPHDGHAILVGGGPSLADNLSGIRARVADGQVVFALNGTAKYLRDHGIEAHCGVILDPRPENARFIIDGPRWLLASQCDPSLPDVALPSAWLWHFLAEGAQDTIPPEKRDDAMWVRGGITVGLTALCLVFALGYRQIHLYGYDSSDRDDEGHAYEQHETSAEQTRVTAWCDGESYRCGIAMFSQAHSFQTWAALLAENGATITVHGDGLLPAVAREMQRTAMITEDKAA